MTEKEEQHKLIESELYNYHYAKADIKRLELNLTKAKERLSDAYIPPNMAVNPQLARIQKPSPELSQVERMVNRILDKGWQREIDEIDKQLDRKRDICARILLWLRCGNLTGREEQYVRLRYLENNPAKKLPGMMHFEERELRNIRVMALDKLQKPYEEHYKKSEA